MTLKATTFWSRYDESMLRYGRPWGRLSKGFG
jgi:hypothetical protein